MDKEYYTQEEAIKILINVEAQKQVVRAVKTYGIEGTEDKIKELYARHPKLKERLLEALYSLYRYNTKG